MRRSRPSLWFALLALGPALGCLGGSGELDALRERNAWLEQQLATQQAAEPAAEQPEVDPASSAVPAVPPGEPTPNDADERDGQLERLLFEQEAAFKKIDERLARIESKLDVIDGKLPAEVKDPPRPGRPDPALRYRVTLDDANLRGPRDAKVTVVIFSDFQCPFCKRVNATLEDVQRRYKADVRFAYKHNPLAFHKDALPAAKAAEAAAAQGKFWEMHDLLFEHNRELTSENFDKWARQLGLDGASFRKAQEDAEIAKRIANHQAEATRLGARGTPAFFINGRFLSGAQPLNAFETLIDAEIATADSLIAKGTARADVYSELMKDARTGV